MTERAHLEICRLAPALEPALVRFFARLLDSGAATNFHPHPLTAEEGAKLVRYEGRDLFYAMVCGDEIVSYGMLRGWDEGYDVPSLGIAVDPSVEGRGYGRLMMLFLHASARLRGARHVRLKVYPSNQRAVRLYESLGYRFDEVDREQLVGTIDLLPVANE